MDYKGVGFKSGIEVHQQLDSHKLFCECLSLLRKDEPEFEISRKLHAVAGEKGEVDIAAKHEAEKDKKFVYQGYDSTCLVEMDEEPPHEINQEALGIALHISLLFNCEILPVTQIMRKTVIDGSNTSGFQRTVLIARNGFVETSLGKVGISAVILEEDAARIFQRNETGTIYKLDRLGIPLIEVVTAPDIKNPEHAKEVALKLGDILRACKVKRGIGTIRQDVSISIKGSSRVEIKGLQEPKLIIPTIDNEIKRLEGIKKHEPEVVKSNPDATTSFLRPLPGSARMYPETDLPLLRISKQMVDHARKTLPKLREEVKEELKGKGLSEEMMNLILGQGLLEDFKALLPIYNHANFIAKVLILLPKELEAKYGKKAERLTPEIIESIVRKVAEKKIAEEDVKKVMIKIVEGEEFDKAIKVEKTDLRKVEQYIIELIKEKPGLSHGAYMGLVMKEFLGKVQGGQVMEILKRLV